MKLHLCRLRCLRPYMNYKVFMGLVPLLLITHIFIYVLFFVSPSVKIISLQELPSQLVPVPINMSAVNSSKLDYCDIMTVVMDGRIESISPDETVSDQTIEAIPERFHVREGGWWAPDSCLPRHHVAIIVPYRNRSDSLKVFLAYMHPFLQIQNIFYRIFIVEQTDRRPFNRAKLFNIGYNESQKIFNYPCYIFHDVDLIPQSLNNIYACTKLPRHMSANIDIFKYKVPYENIIGGAVAITKSNFVQINGFSNTFFGWGGEDDDFYQRVTQNGTKICRFTPSISKYVMLRHKKEVPSRDRYYFLRTGEDRFSTDGLNSLKYTVLKREFLPLYTRLLVDL